MSDFRPAIDQLTDTVRLALARGDRESARLSLSAASSIGASGESIAAETPDALMRLGALHQDAGLTVEAERLFGDALAVAERTLGPEHPAAGQALTRLGMALIARGAHDDAEPLLRRALSINEQLGGDENPDLNVLLNALSRVYLRGNAFERAAPLLERLLEMKRVKGEDHPEVATVLASLVLVRQGVGDHEGAEQLARRVLQIRERTLAPNHYGIASALELLADACSARGKVGEAVLLCQRALSIREQTLGVSHASLRVTRERIADLQLQAAEERGEADFVLPIQAPTPLVLAPPRPVKLPPDAAAVLPDGLAVAARTAPVPASDPTRSAPRARLVESERAGVDRATPVFDDVLSLPEEPDAQDHFGVASPGEAMTARAATIWGAISARRTGVGVTAAAVLALLLVARIAQSRGTDEGGARPRTDKGHAGLAATRKLDVSPASNGARVDSALVRTSLGSVEPSAASTPISARPAQAVRDLVTRSARNDENSRGDSRNLDIERVVRVPLPAVNLPAGDSLTRATEPKVGADAFSKQFWTSAIDKKSAAEPNSPRNAQLIGYTPQPFYPDFLRKNGIEGEVVVQFVVDLTGRPDMSTLEVVRSPHDALTTSVRKVVERMRFEPAMTGGTTPTPRTEVVQISFAFRSTTK